MDFVSVRFFCDSLETAVEVLIIVLEDARETDKEYSFGSLSAQQVLSSGLLIIGDAQHLVDKLSTLSGTTQTAD